MKLNEPMAAIAKQFADLTLEREKLEYEHARKLRSINAELNNLVEKMALYVDVAKQGCIYVKTWSRDCDMCESTHVLKVDSVDEYYDALESFCEGLEGPGSFTRCTKKEYEAERANPTPTRDRITEAWENGNGNSIYV